MTYAAVITHIQTGDEAKARMTCALDMARRFKATVIGIGAEMIPPLAFDGGYYSLEADWATAMRQGIDDRLQLARTAFAAAAKAQGTQAIWESGLQLPGPAIAAASRAADLIVASRTVDRHSDPYRDAGAGELALTSGRPVLAVPGQGQALVGKQVVVAWKDTREARRALADAMPFLEAADMVHVLSVCAEIDAEQAKIQVDDVAAALVRRGAKAEGKVVADAHPGGAAILREAALVDADLIVCGAYGHTRFGEWVFGGVTRDLLSQDDHYLLLSH